MQVDRARLALHIGLPASADESMIRARLAGLDTEKTVRAAQTRRPAGRRLDTASLHAASDEELRLLAASGVTPADRHAINSEMSDRAFMATHFPGVSPAANGRARIHSYSG